MNKILVAIFCLFFAVTSLRAEEVQAPLEAGNYLLVYQTKNIGMRSLKISFMKEADGRLTLSCADTSYLPTTVIQAQSIFQFGLTKPGHRDEANNTAGTLETLYFVGRPNVIFTEQHDYKQVPGESTGTVAIITASVQPGSGVDGAASGTFLLYKLP